MPYSNGRVVPPKERAETIATYLENKHCGQGPLPSLAQIGANIQCDSSPFTNTELHGILKRTNLGKQPGPDQIVMEL